ncbi:hypothetical protein [Streptomyces cellulosae]|uniref:FXSXX-COOH protein n=1 Tax=Streptomyces cellulosae TaxID=1968 RepID=A0ABW7YIG8_STRCE
MEQQPKKSSPTTVDDQSPEFVPYPALSPAFGPVSASALRSAGVADLHPIPSAQELLTAVLAPFKARPASLTVTTCPPRASAGPDKEL